MASQSEQHEVATAIDGVIDEIRGECGIITLTNPGRLNAFYYEMRERLVHVIKAYEVNPDIRVIILTGADGHFCAGADLKRRHDGRDQTAVAGRSEIEHVHRTLRMIVDGGKPFVAAVEGVCYGAGLSMALGCDFVIASQTSQFCAVFAKIGFMPDMGMLYTLPQRVGRSKANWMLMTAKPVSASQALDIGLVDEVVPEGQALDRALQLADQLSENGPAALSTIKAALARGINSLQQALELERDLAPSLALGPEAQQAIEAFVAKRPFNFKRNR